MDLRDEDAPRNMGRRRLLASAGAAALGMAAGGFDSVSDRPGRPILGSGHARYAATHDWLTPPDAIRWGDTHAAAQDSAGRIYIAHTVHPTSPCGDAVVVFDHRGRFLRSWGERFRGGAHGLQLRREGAHEFFYICDIAHRLLVKTTLDGAVIWEKGAPQESGRYQTTDPFIPTNVAFSPDGGFYVTDGYGSNWIHQYDAGANYVRTFGGKGSEPGRVLCPHGIWVDERGAEPLLAVADRGNNRLQYLTLDGRHVSFVTEGMRQPCHFARRGDMVVIPDLSSVVTLLDRDNRVIAHLGDGYPSNLRGASRDRFRPGKFIHPHDAIFLHSGDILVTEWVPIGRITLLHKVS